MSKKFEIKRRIPRPSTVLAAVAVFAALAGTATAANGLINGKQIKKGTITGKQVKNKSLGVAELKPSAVKQLRGAKGAKGEVGPQGPAGITTPTYFQDGGTTNLADGVEAPVATAPVTSAGKYVITARLQLFAVSDDTRLDCRLEVAGHDVDQIRWTAGAANSYGPVSLIAVTDVTPAAPIQVFCESDGGTGSASGKKIVAIPVS